MYIFCCYIFINVNKRCKMYFKNIYLNGKIQLCPIRYWTFLYSCIFIIIFKIFVKLSCFLFYNNILYVLNVLIFINTKNIVLCPFKILKNIFITIYFK